MKYRRKLLCYPRIYDVPGSDGLFLGAMREITAWHILHCPAYADIVRQQGFKLRSLRTMGDLHRIPPMPPLFLKRHTLLSRPENRMIINATTSGTSGRKSTVGIDVNTGLFALEMVLRSFAHYRLISPIPTNYIILGYQPSKHNQAGIVKTAFGFTLITPALHREYALKDTGDSYEVNIDGLIAALLRYQKQGLPVRLMGLPAYHYLLLTTLKERGIHLKLNPASYLCMGGGWKQFYFEHADKGELYALADEVLGIPESRCVHRLLRRGGTPGVILRLQKPPFPRPGIQPGHYPGCAYPAACAKGCAGHTEPGVAAYAQHAAAQYYDRRFGYFA